MFPYYVVAEEGWLLVLRRSLRFPPRPLRYGEWIIELVSPTICRIRHESLRHVEIMFTYRSLRSLILRNEITVRGLIERIEFLEDILAEGYYHTGLHGTLYEFMRMAYSDEEGERWLVKASGDVDFQVECSTSEALSLALLFNDIFDPDVGPSPGEIYKFTADRGLLPLFRRIERAMLKHEGARCLLVREENEYYLIPERAGRCEELETLMSLADSIGTSLHVPISEEGSVRILLSIQDLSSVLSSSDFMVELRKFLIHSVVSRMKFRGEVKYGRRRIVIRNSYGTWKIDLRNGSLTLNHYSLCISETPDVPGLIKASDLGLVRLDRTTSRAIGAVLVALKPHTVRDPILRRQIRRRSVPLSLTSSWNSSWNR